MIKRRITNNSAILFLALTFLFYLVPNTTYAQGPNAAEAASFEPVDATDMVNLVTGDLSYVLPLLNIPSPEGGYPIALSYHAGIAMDQEASWVGLGWSLNPGAINRGVNGYPDDWGKTNVNEFFYDNGWIVDYYSFSAGVTISDAVSVGLGLSWGSNQSLGGYVSASIGIGDQASVGISIGTNGVGLNAGFSNGLSASIDSNGNMGIGYNKKGFSSSINNNGINVGYKNINTSYGFKSGKLSGSFSVKMGSLGMSFDTEGSVGLSMAGAGISMSAHNISSGDYDVTVSSSGFTLPVYIFYIGYNHTKVKYSLYKYNNLYTSGMVYPVVANELQPNSGKPGLSRWMNENHFMDVNVVQKFGSDNLYDDLIENSNKNDRNNLVLPNYDNYSVNAQGLSGSISPYIHSELNLSARGRGEQNTDNEYVQYLNYDYEKEYTKSVASHGQPVNYDAISKKYFSFTSAFNSFLRLETSNIQGSGGIATSEYLMKTFITSSTYSFDNYGSLKNNRKREGNNIETYTNKEIRENSIVGFIEAKEGNNLLDRQDTDTFLDEGIGAFKITSLDGKTYHYSLPVYQFESFYKNFSKVNGNGDDIASEDENFFEIQKTTPYASHWLLTAITGPDYFDKNNNGKVDEQDYGYWVEFDYGKWSDGYTWQTPNGRIEEIADKKDTTKKTYAYSWGRKQIYYLDAIKTRTHTALFVKDLRIDNQSSTKMNQIKTFNSSKITQEYYGYERQDAILNNGTWYYFNVFRTINSYKSTINNITFTKQKTLKLNKILILDNKILENEFFDKSTSTLISENSNSISKKLLKHRNYQLSRHYSYSSPHDPNPPYPFYETFGAVSMEPEIQELLNPKIFKSQFAKNVIDIKDIEGLDLESKASQVIEFNHDYSLATGAPNTEINKGRLTLNKVSFKGKKGVQLVPPYEFNYFNSSLTYNKNHIDDWGYHKYTPQTWSLDEITTPTGGKIKMVYEPDAYYAEAAYADEKGFSDIASTSLNGTTFTLNFQTSSNLQNYFTKDRYYKIIYSTEEEIEDQWGQFQLINNTVEENYKVVDVGSNWVKINNTTYEDLFQYNPTSNCNFQMKRFCITSVTIYGNESRFNIDKNGGGIRTKSIAVSEGVKNIATTEYKYEGGITSYAPTKEQRGVPYVSELPAPMVMYRSVNMITKDGQNKLLGNTVYEFETLEPRKEETGYIFSLGEAFRVKENQNQTFENGIVTANKYTIESKLGNLGRINSITSYNAKNQVLNKKENTYKQNLDADGEIGVSQESHSSYKRVKKNNSEKFYVSSTSKVNYPSVLESTKQTQSGFSIEKHFDKYDFLTGQLLETRTYASDGTAFKTKTVPAYTILAYSGNVNGYGMGSKVDNSTNKNMLTQQAASYTYLLDEVNNTEKVIGAGITTWNNDWTYRDHSGLETTPTNNVEKIWRKHKSYFWKGDIDNDGAYVGFATNDDGFVWGLGLPQTNDKWKQASEIKRYDHYSAPLETMDINNNFASTKMCDSDSKIMAVSNAKYTEMFYSGAEYVSSNSLYFDGEVKSFGRTPDKAHTGTYSVVASVNQPVFEVNLKTGEHRAGKYKVSVWVDKTNYLNARININGITKTFNGEQLVAGDWVLLNHYEDLSSGGETVYLTSTSGIIYFDDFRLMPIASSMSSYVYNEWDELWYIIGTNGLSTMYEYDSAGRLIKTYMEVVTNSAVVGGFKLVRANNYNYKSNAGTAPAPITTYSVSAVTNGNGTVTLSSNSVSEGGSITVTVTPNSGYQIASIKVNGVLYPISSSFSINNITNDTVIDVAFSLIVSNTLTVTPTYLSYEWIDIAKTITVKSSGSWTASTSSSWLILSKTSGVGDDSFTVRPLKNLSYERFGTVTVKNGSLIKTISINQMSNSSIVPQ